MQADRCERGSTSESRRTSRLTVAIWTVGACLGAGAAGALAEEAPPPSNAARAFIAKGVAHVLAGCSKPYPPKTCPHGRRVKVGPLQRYRDQNSGVPFEYRKVEYEGLAMTYRAHEVVELTVSSAAWPVRHGLVVGVPFERVTARLGQPMALQDGGVPAEEVALYCHGEDCVTFTIERRSGRVAKIAWAFYYD
jgi:hypothetical protein